MLKTELDKEIKYCEKDIVYGKDILKKLFIIDIRNMNDEDINYIFENFDEIQRVLLSDIFLANKKELKTLFHIKIYFMASPIGFEPTTYRLGGDCSILLSYEDTLKL